MTSVISRFRAAAVTEGGFTVNGVDVDLDDVGLRVLDDVGMWVDVEVDDVDAVTVAVVSLTLFFLSFFKAFNFAARCSIFARISSTSSSVPLRITTSSSV